jgi:uncharacterized protein YodC (DUF2158 family)
MATDFKPGDVVQLKSGGPAMTVSDKSAGQTVCEWFEGSSPKRANFKTATLAKIEPKKLADYLG